MRGYAEHKQKRSAGTVIVYDIYIYEEMIYIFLYIYYYKQYE